MRRIDRTTGLFVQSVRDAMPNATTTVSYSSNAYGQSRYVFIGFGNAKVAYGRVTLKVRISDHPIGMRRARSGECALHLTHNAKPASWAVWLSEWVKEYERIEKREQELAEKDADK